MVVFFVCFLIDMQKKNSACVFRRSNIPFNIENITFHSFFRAITPMKSTNSDPYVEKKDSKRGERERERGKNYIIKNKDNN